MGLPGSGKTTLASELSPLINAKRIKSNPPKIPVHFLLVFDDSLTRSNKYNEQVLKVFQFGRINHINCILLQQNVQEISTTIRDNCSYFGTFKQNTFRQKKIHIWKLCSRFIDNLGWSGRDRKIGRLMLGIERFLHILNIWKYSIIFKK